jgi:hypothetical protein
MELNYGTLVDNYKTIAVIDSTRSFSGSECLYVNMTKNEITHLSTNSSTSFYFDELVSSYD